GTRVAAATQRRFPATWLRAVRCVLAGALCVGTRRPRRGGPATFSRPRVVESAGKIVARADFGVCAASRGGDDRGTDGPTRWLRRGAGGLAVRRATSVWLAGI